ncbi:MAG: glycosyltransferase family 39 protein [Kofleriaceae bacterium]|nr:glycosyltransferase family 39 protein [Kofleriaceae bacterium]
MTAKGTSATRAPGKRSWNPLSWSQRWQNRAIAVLLFILASTMVISAQRDQGVVRDEVIYMNFGSRYADWWGEFATGKDGITSKESITRFFGGKAATAGNREHPPLMKTLFGLSEKLLHDKLGWTSETTAYRVPTALLNALLIALVFLFVSGIWGFSAGLLSALLLLFLPRAFFHSGLATFDAPVVTFWFASLWAYQRSLRTRWGFLLLGLCAGLTLATKHNAILLPAILIPHYCYTVWRARASEGKWHVRLWNALRNSRPQTFLGLFLIAPLVLIAIWPWLWFDTMTHLREWMDFHFTHVHYNFEYLGKNWNAPPFPWHIALVTTLFTVPLATSVAGISGFIMLVRGFFRFGPDDENRFPTLLLFLSAGVAMGPFLLRSTPIFGAEKHWAPAIPTMCIFAGVGLVLLSESTSTAISLFWPKLKGRWVRNATIGLVSTIVVGAAFWETQHAQPYALSHYNALAGGASGGADYGMNRQFWGYSARGVLPFVNGFSKPGQTVPVYTHDASPAWGRYRQLELLAPGLPNSGREVAGIRKSKIAIVIHEKHFNRHDYLIWDAYKKVQPTFVLLYDGVPLVSVYVRDELLGEE